MSAPTLAGRSTRALVVDHDEPVGRRRHGHRVDVERAAGGVAGLDERVPPLAGVLVAAGVGDGAVGSPSGRVEVTVVRIAQLDLGRRRRRVDAEHQRHRPVSFRFSASDPKKRYEARRREVVDRARPRRPKCRPPCQKLVVEVGLVGVVGAVGALELVELGDDRVDVGLGAGDALAAHPHQLAGPPDPLGEHVDVELVPLELLEDVLELRHRTRRTRPSVVLVVASPRRPLSLLARLGPVLGPVIGALDGSTGVVAVPSANSTASVLPAGDRRRARVSTRPSASRVIV